MEQIDSIRVKLRYRNKQSDWMEESLGCQVMPNIQDNEIFYDSSSKKKPLSPSNRSELLTSQSPCSKTNVALLDRVADYQQSPQPPSANPQSPSKNGGAAIKKLPPQPNENQQQQFIADRQFFSFAENYYQSEYAPAKDIKYNNVSLFEIEIGKHYLEISGINSATSNPANSKQLKPILYAISELNGLVLQQSSQHQHIFAQQSPLKFSKLSQQQYATSRGESLSELYGEDPNQLHEFYEFFQYVSESCWRRNKKQAKHNYSAASYKIGDPNHSFIKIWLQTSESVWSDANWVFKGKANQEQAQVVSALQRLLLSTAKSRQLQ
ncbi:UNKNOWN [Stylonychia lemnae]|uniref:Uncharacterized protein n=1 Tax=Stylonychia lemnae TaxID=5949 RepID=A0A078A904_STYLE|nr:UNKNOWN [Stylonychia lemnae]|eukprot:CDW78699.1 UNKNOWN [Stylonychia lemnae]